MKINVPLTFGQIDLLRAVMFEYYKNNEVMCEEELMLRDQLEDILADAEEMVLTSSDDKEIV